MSEELPSIISLFFKKQKREYVYEVMPLASIFFLLWNGTWVEVWLIFLVVLVSVLKISLGEVLKSNVKRKPEIVEQVKQQYLKYFSSARKNIRASPKEFYKFIETIPLPKRMAKIYLIVIGIFLITYALVMGFTLAQGTPKIMALFLVQLAAIAFAYSKIFTRLFGEV